jgi:beta-glucosidase
MAVSDVRGLQSVNCIATLKHFVANNKEDNRKLLSAQVGERLLREIYMAGFKKLVLEGKALGVMAAYNMINGSYACSFKYTMTDVLRDEWGFKGFAMTDWGASIDDFRTSALYGVDLIMPGRGSYTAGSFQSVGENIVNMHARRIIYANKMIGALEPGYNSTEFQSYLLSDEHRQVVRRIGKAGIILARNNGGILPLPKKGASIALTGPYVSICRTGGSGSSVVRPMVLINPQQAVQEKLGSVGAGASTLTTDIGRADYIVVFVGVSGEGEGSDRPTLHLADGDNDVASALNVNPGKTIVVFTGGSACTEGNWSEAPAIVMAFYPGQEQGYSIADVLFGDQSPSGKLPVTFPRNASQVPDFSLRNNQLHYDLHGYFKVNEMGEEPLFPFGHGLTYTTFEYGGLAVVPSSIAAGDRIFVQADVTNTGNRTGQEVVQLYLSLPDNRGVDVRVQDLKGFRKLSLGPGEKKTVTFILTPPDMAYFDNGGSDFDGDGTWKILAGAYGVRVGTSSQINQRPTLSGGFTVQ